MNPYSKLLISVSCMLSSAVALADPPTAVAAAPTSVQRPSSISKLRPPPPAVAPVVPGSKQQLNPQPLPPKVWGIDPGTTNSLNPQPLPPKDWGTQQQPSVSAAGAAEAATRQ
jgi:hypothetical protein